jgi:hypothetical protein
MAQQRPNQPPNQDLRVATPYTSHPVKLELLRTYLAVTALGLSGAVAAFTWAIFRWFFAYHHFGPAVVGRWTTPALLLSLVLAAIGAIGLILYLSARSYRVTTNEVGVLITKRNHTVSIPWEEIEFVRSSSTVKANLYPRYLTRYRQHLNQGQSIDFGPVQLTPNGIVFGRKECHWSALEGVSLARGRLTITVNTGPRMKSYSIPARKIPNSDLCAQLIQNIEY